MPNYLKMPKKSQVLALLELGWSYRRIEAETGVRRETVSRGTTGCAGQMRPKRSPAPTGRHPTESADRAGGRRFKCGQNVRRLGRKPGQNVPRLGAAAAVHRRACIARRSPRSSTPV